MSSNDRRTAARRRAWGRGPHILRFEPLEGRQLLSADPLGAISEAVDIATESAASLVPATSTPTTTTVATTTTTTTGLADKAKIVASSFSTDHNLDWGDEFQAVGSVRNTGDTPNAQPYKVDVYASSTPTPGPDAVLVGSVTIPAGIAPGASASFNQNLSAPPVPLTDLGDAPSYFLTPKVTAEHSTASSATAPAAMATAPPTLTSVVTITPKIPPKLVGAGVTVSPGSVSWGDTITVTASVTNDAAGAAPPTNARIILTPVDKTPGLGSDYQIGQVPIPPISPYQTVSASQRITLPKFAPTTLSNSNKYVVTMLQDADATANPLILPFVPSSPQNTTSLAIAGSKTTAATPSPSPSPTSTTTVPATSPVPVPEATKPAPADLAITDVQEPTPVMFRGATFPVGATIENRGAGDAGSFKVRFLLVTDESPNAPALALGDAVIPGLKANTKIDVLQTVKIPYRTPDGFEIDSPTARVVAVVDPDHAIDQASTANDTLAAPVVQLRLLTADAQTNLPTLPGAPASSSSASTAATVTSTPATTATVAPSTPEAATPEIPIASQPDSPAVDAQPDPTADSSPIAQTTVTAAPASGSKAQVHTQVIKKTQSQARRLKLKQQQQLKQRKLKQHQQLKQQKLKQQQAKKAARLEVARRAAKAAHPANARAASTASNGANA